MRLPGGILLAAFLTTATTAVAQTTDATAQAVRGLARADTAVVPDMTARGAVFSGSIDPDAYRIGPGDVFRVTVWGQVTRSDDIIVSPEGMFVTPLFGSIRVDDLTLAEARRRILEGMRRQLRNVQIDVQLARPRQFAVYRTGRVHEPGPVVASGLLRISDILPPTTLEDDASLRRIQVLHRDGTRETADVGLFLLTGDSAQDPWLRDGDVVNVPPASAFVYANGALARPGRYELGARDSVSTLVRMAGGLLPSAILDHALLMSWSSRERPDSLWLAVGGGSGPTLREGDRLYVYFLPSYHEQPEVALYGEIRRPGSYPIVEGVTRLSQLLEAGGGFLPTADLGAIRLIRPLTTHGERDAELDRLLRLSSDQLTPSEYEKLRTKLAEQREGYRVDWNRMNDHGRDLDLLLRNGDIVRVEKLVSSIRIDGEVLRPGILAYAPGYTVEDYVRRAGGYSRRAWRSRVRVTRAVTGQSLYAKDIIRIGPGDFVWVPEKPDRNLGRAGLNLVTTLASLATVAIAIASFHK